MVTAVCQRLPKPIIVAGVFGAVVACRGPMVLLMKNFSGSEGSQRELIDAKKYWLCVPSLSYLGSLEMVQVMTLVIIAGTQDLSEIM